MDLNIIDLFIKKKAIFQRFPQVLGQIDKTSPICSAILNYNNIHSNDSIEVIYEDIEG